MATDDRQGGLVSDSDWRTPPSSAVVLEWALLPPADPLPTEGRPARSGRQLIAVAGALVLLGVVGLLVLPLEVRGRADYVTGRFRVSGDILGEPLLHGRIVALASSDRFIGYDIGSGEVAWTSRPCPSPSIAAPAGYQQADRVAVVCGFDRVRMLDLDTGEFLWQYRAPRSWTMLRVGGDSVVVGMGTSVTVLDIESGRPRFAWRPLHQQDLDLTVAVGEGTVLIGEDESLLAFDTNGHLRWRIASEPSTSWIYEGRAIVREPQSYFRVLSLATGRQYDHDYTSAITTQYSMIVDVQGRRALLAVGGERPRVFAVNRHTGFLAWHSDRSRSIRYLAVGRGNVAVVDDGHCMLRSVDDGHRTGRCPPETVAVGMDAARAAYLRSSGGRHFTLDVRLLPH